LKGWETAVVLMGLALGMRLGAGLLVVMMAVA
jgi:hypothetical protein